MNWLFVAVLGGNLMTATFPNEAGCLGQESITQRDQHVMGQCVNLNSVRTGTTGTLPTWIPGAIPQNDVVPYILPGPGNVVR
jgi:hypothetical protein